MSHPVFVFTYYLSYFLFCFVIHLSFQIPTYVPWFTFVIVCIYLIRFTSVLLMLNPLHMFSQSPVSVCLCQAFQNLLFFMFLVLIFALPSGLCLLLLPGGFVCSIHD